MCKNHKHSYTLIIDKQRAKSRAIHNSYKENKIPRNTTNKGCKRPLQKENKIPKNTTNKGCKRPLREELQTTAQGNERI